MTKQSHRIVLTVNFERPCSLEEALSIARDHLAGRRFYPDTVDPTRPGVMRVRTLTSVNEEVNRRRGGKARPIVSSVGKI